MGGPTPGQALLERRATRPAHPHKSQRHAGPGGDSKRGAACTAPAPSPDDLLPARLPRCRHAGPGGSSQGHRACGLQARPAGFCRAVCVVRPGPQQHAVPCRVHGHDRVPPGAVGAAGSGNVSRPACSVDVREGGERPTGPPPASNRPPTAARPPCCFPRVPAAPLQRSMRRRLARSRWTSAR